MAEVVKVKERKKLVKKEEEQTKKKNQKEVKDKAVKQEVEKKSMWGKFMTFWYGVGSEFKKVRWTSKKDMLKYSIATIIFIVFCSIFFYGIDTIFAFIQSLFS